MHSRYKDEADVSDRRTHDSPCTLAHVSFLEPGKCCLTLHSACREEERQKKELEIYIIRIVLTQQTINKPSQNP